ncbi:hypothetical protein AB0F71_28770 [Kitasatospora sp. NPDC028055]|uniref:hypothetical protein n=1 Tax=Kitasatospora sp. NPDC028055 TaxID=3155653 RepID=UPI0033C6F914
MTEATSGTAAVTRVPPAVRRSVGTEYEFKWRLDPAEARSAPLDLLTDGLFDRHLTSCSPPVTVTQSTMYADDADFGLTRAGHSLGCVVNSGRASSVAWLRLKQTVLWDGRRDCLEVSEKVDPARVGALLNDPAVLPVGHLRRYGMARGRLAPVGVLTQVRHKRTGAFREIPAWLAYSVDLVEFRSPQDGVAPLGRYACLEVEVNDSTPDVLALLDELAAGLDGLLGGRRERLTKGQLAALAANPGRLTVQDLAPGPGTAPEHRS